MVLEKLEWEFDVTEDIINRSVRKDPNRCAIAVAVREQLGWPGEVEVDGDIELSNDEHYRADLDGAIDEFIVDFDKGEPVGPIKVKARFVPRCVVES